MEDGLDVEDRTAPDIRRTDVPRRRHEVRSPGGGALQLSDVPLDRGRTRRGRRCHVPVVRVVRVVAADVGQPRRAGALASTAGTAARAPDGGSDASGGAPAADTSGNAARQN